VNDMPPPRKACVRRGHKHDHPVVGHCRFANDNGPHVYDDDCTLCGEQADAAMGLT
jgi:hypothetical protein